jgi:predicted permease
MMESLAKDVVYTLRDLRRNPGFAAVTLLTLALGIGANTAMFSVLEGVVLRPLPYHEPHRLVAVWPAMNFNLSLVDSVASKAATLDGVAGVSHWGLTLTGGGGAESVRAAVVSTSYFDVLGVPPARGRGFLPEERDPDRSDVVVLSHGFWERRFGADPQLLGRRIRLEGYDKENRQVIGIAPPGFQPPDRRVDVWIPLHLRPGHTVATDSTWYVNHVVGRLAQGATVERAGADVARVAHTLQEEFPERLDEDLVRMATVTPLMDELLGDAGGLLWLLLGAVGLVLVIACANLANLLLARGSAQARDAAVRTALGATPARLIRQHLTASAVLALLGAAVGLGLAQLALAFLLPGLSPSQLPRAHQVGLSPGVLAFTAGLAMVSALAFGLVPALRIGIGGLRGTLEGGGRGGTGTRSAHRLNRGLVVVETALAVVLVISAGLMLQSVWNLYRTDPGFDPRRVVAVELAPSTTRYQGQGELSRAFLAQVEEGMRAIPGVETVGAIHLLPFTLSNWSFPYLAQGHTPPENAPLPSANFRIVTPEYFATVGIPLQRGRGLTGADGPGDLPVGLVNEAMADLLWPGEDPVGKEIRVFGNDPFQVVGVVGNVRQHGLEREPRPEMYRPFLQYSWPGVVMMVRAPGADVASLAPALRRAVWAADPDVPVPSIQPLDQVMADSMARPRFFAQLLGAFGFLGLLLGVVGIYGVMSYAMGARLRELGVRAALGAEPGTLLRDALAMGMLPVGMGLALGGGGAWLATRLLEGALHGVTPHDAPTFVAVMAILGAAALLANWIPARRASRVDPAEVLRSE